MIPLGTRLSGDFHRIGKLFLGLSSVSSKCTGNKWNSHHGSDVSGRTFTKEVDKGENHSFDLAALEKVSLPVC